MHKGYFQQPKADNICRESHLTKRESWHDFTLDDKINVVHEVLVEKRPLKVVAEKYFRTEGYVGRLVRRVRDNRALLREMIDVRDQAIATDATIKEVLKELLQKETFIESLEQVVDEIHNRHQLKVSKHKVSQLMKEQGIRWKKVKQVAVQSNSVRCLVLRQRWAISFLKMDLKNKNCINVDETWLGMADFRKMHWRPMDRSWSVKEKLIAPRLSLITAVDQLGNVWISLTQSNSNKSMMGVFMQHFCRKMDQRNAHWRNSHVLLWDGKYRFDFT